MSKKQSSSFWQAANKMTQEMKQAIAKTASQAGQSMSEKAADFTGELRDRATGTARDLTSAIGKQAEQAGQAMSDRATAVSNSATQTTKTWIDQIHQGQSSEASAPISEVYHVFIGYELAQKGGYQNVTLKSGKSYDVKINPPLKNDCKMRLKKCGLQGNDAFVIFHTLFDESLNIYRQINQPIAHSSLATRNKTKCSDAYSVLNAGRAVEDLRALDLLDCMVLSANSTRDIRQRYIVGSQNSRLVCLEECLAETLACSYLSEAKQRFIKGTYQFIRAGEPVANFTSWHQLNAMMLSSYLFPELVEQYLIASATSVALTVDGGIEQLMVNKIPEKDRQNYLSVYQNIRDGEPVDDSDTLKVLDGLILTADIPEVGKTIYKLARDRFFESEEDFEETDFIEVFKQYKKTLKFVRETAAKVNSGEGIWETGERLSTFSGNSVAEGNLGLLAEPAVPQIGIGFIRATVLCAIASFSEMETQEKIYLGITQSENISSHNPRTPADIYNGIVGMLDGLAYQQFSSNSSNTLGGFVSNFMPGNLDKQRMIRELEQRLDN